MPIAELVIAGLAAIGDHENVIGGAIIMAHGAGAAFRLVNAGVRNFLPLLGRRYLGTSEGAQANAATNIVAASTRLKETIDQYVADGRLTEDQGRAAFDDPAFALLFNDRLLDASETSDPMMHDTLAKLVVERMTKTSGTAEALLISIAAARLRDLGSRQLRLIGAIFVAEHVYIEDFPTRGSAQADFDFYVEQCMVEVRPHWDTVVLQQDLEHLELLTLLGLSDDRLHRRILGGGLQAPMVTNALRLYPGQMQVAAPAPVFQHLQAWMQGNGNRGIAFQYASLTQTGWIIGAVVHAHLRGLPADLGKWQ